MLEFIVGFYHMINWDTALQYVIFVCFTNVFVCYRLRVYEQNDCHHVSLCFSHVIVRYYLLGVYLCDILPRYVL